MAYKSFKPYTPGRRQMTVSTFEEITTVVTLKPGEAIELFEG